MSVSVAVAEGLKKLEAEKQLIAKAACDCIESMGPLFYTTTDGRDDPDVLVCPFPLRPEDDRDGYIFDPDFSFDLSLFLGKLEALSEHTVGFDDVNITYSNDGLHVSLLGEDDQDDLSEAVIRSEILWIWILREPPDYVDVGGTLMNDGSVVFDKPMPAEN